MCVNYRGQKQRGMVSSSLRLEVLPHIVEKKRHGDESGLCAVGMRTPVHSLWLCRGLDEFDLVLERSQNYKSYFLNINKHKT